MKTLLQLQKILQGRADASDKRSLLVKLGLFILANVIAIVGIFIEFSSYHPTISIVG